MAAGKMDEARSKFIEAVIAEPYNRSPRMGLQQWAEHNKVQFHVLQINPGSSVKTEAGKTTITIDAGNLKGDKDEDGSSAWLMYGMSRALWQGEKFKKEFPNEPKYRHTLKEEAEALSGVAKVAAEVMSSKKNKKKKMQPDLAELVRLDEAGMLESYILLFRPDEGIAQDYEAYRSANREKLRRYLDEFVVAKLPAEGAAKPQ
jgi:hypothetical protein